MRHLDTRHVQAAVGAVRRRPAGASVLLVDPWWPVWGATRTTLAALRAAGMSVTPAADGRTALIVAQELRYDVAVVELATGVRGGWHAVQVAARLLELEPAPRVLLATAAKSVDDGPLYVNGVVVPVVRAADLVAAVTAAAAR